MYCTLSRDGVLQIQSLGHDMALGRGAGRAAGRARRAGRRRGVQMGARGAQAGAQAWGTAGVRSRRARRALGVRACWASERRRTGEALGVSVRGASARGARPGRAAWACLCAWWACWLGQLDQFEFW